MLFFAEQEIEPDRVRGKWNFDMVVSSMVAPTIHVWDNEGE